MNPSVIFVLAIGAGFCIGVIFGRSIAESEFAGAAAKLEPAMSIAQQFVGLPKDVVFHSYRSGATYRCIRQDDPAPDK